MSSDCRPFIQPDTAMSTNRNGSKTLDMAEVTLCLAPAKGMHIYHGIKDIDFSDTTRCGDGDCPLQHPIGGDP